jgi:hypothetical protein
MFISVANLDLLDLDPKFAPADLEPDPVYMIYLYLEKSISTISVKICSRLKQNFTLFTKVLKEYMDPDPVCLRSDSIQSETDGIRITDGS